MKPIIEIKNVGKRYSIIGKKGGYVALRDVITENFLHPFKFIKSIFNKNGSETFWALRNFNLEVFKGEAIGIIGANGAGKSTLLKILSRITPPTEGEITIHGRIASLLEVGTGFHPELSGRENIYLNGAILGMTKQEIEKKFDAIVEFSGIGNFIDTPVKRYSTGMYVRLAFSIAAHIEPDILLVDEVLAVGDAEFQKKCLGKMEEVTGTAGRTILFVSHNMSAVEKLCPKSVLLSKGQLVMFDDTKKVIEHYLQNEYEKNIEGEKLFPLKEKDIIIKRFHTKQRNSKTTHLDCDSPFEVEIDFETLSDLTLFRIGIYVKNSMGDIMIRSFIADWKPELENIKKGNYKITLPFPEKLLTPGNYFIALNAGRFGIINYLAKHQIEKSITVGPSAHFNQAHPTENTGAKILIKNEWQIQTNELPH
ncbi:MAG: ATP-binding cassette domain-containing protein [Candidatus Taylorbacteria bacterium]|nr:ATP-binding cassette domain-containing protein [Candidatus Taylorbacteria bacterium]